LRHSGVTVPECVRQLFIRWRADELLVKYPRLRLVPAPEGVVILSGALAFDAEAPGKKRIIDEYQVKLSIPHSFPDRIPSVLETGGRIPWYFHKLTDGALCLGSSTGCVSSFQSGRHVSTSLNGA